MGTTVVAGDEQIALSELDEITTCVFINQALNIEQQPNVILEESVEAFAITLQETTQAVSLDLQNVALNIEETSITIISTDVGPAGPPGPPGATFKVKQSPLETPDMTRISFTAPDSFVANTLVVTLNGLEEPIAEQAPNMFSFNDPPYIGDFILLRYQPV